MAQEHLNSLLTEAGFDQTDIEAVMALANPAADAAPEVIEASKKALEPFIGKLNTNVSTRIKNDPKFWETLDENNINEGFKKKIETQQYGRAANITKQKFLKLLGYTDADIVDMSEEEKSKLELFIPKVAEKWQSSKSSDKEMQKQLVEARKKLEELELDIPVREGKIKQDYESNFNAEKLDFIILAELATVENLKAPAQYLAQKIAAELKEENAFVINGLKAVPKQKANPALDVLEGSKALSLKDLIVKKLTADGLIGDPNKKDDKKSGISTVDVDPDGKGGLQISSHIAEKIKANTPA